LVVVVKLLLPLFQVPGIQVVGILICRGETQ
jgi:hypothetical protein